MLIEASNTMNNSYLEDIIERIDLITRKVRGSFGFMTDEQLNWKAKRQSWSIAQNLDHIMKYNKGYFPVFIQIANGHKRIRKRERLPLVPDVWGTYYINALKPDARRKLKAHVTHKPSKAPYTSTILDDFIGHQSALIDIVRRLDIEDHEGMVVMSPTNPLAVFSLKDTCRVIALHEERHLKQALGLKDNLSFPGEKK